MSRYAHIVLTGSVVSEEWWWCSAPFATFGVCVATTDTGDQAVIEAAPIARRFVGQHPKALGAWLKGSGGASFERI